MSETPLTMCLCNWARTEQMHDIIDRLWHQTVRPKIFVWNNNPEVYFQNERADVVFNCSQNMHVRHVPGLWQMASTPFVGRMDDDLYPADDRLIADAVEAIAAERHSTRMIGPFGVRLYRDANYEDSHHISVTKGQGQYTGPVKESPLKSTPENHPVDLLKGRFILANTMAAPKLLCNCPHYHVDLYISMALAERRRMWHVCHHCFYDREKEEGRLINYPIDGKGYCDIEGHIEKRNELCDTWAWQCMPHPMVKNKPPTENKYAPKPAGMPPGDQGPPQAI